MLYEKSFALKVLEGNTSKLVIAMKLLHNYCVTPGTLRFISGALTTSCREFTSPHKSCKDAELSKLLMATYIKRFKPM